MKLVKTIGPAVGESANEDIELGQWYWVRDDDDESSWLGCVTHIGSNYFKLDGLDRGGRRYTMRVHFDRMAEAVLRREWVPDEAIESRVELHKRNVDRLMDEIKQLTASLGITPAGALPGPIDGNSTALVAAHNAEDVQAHKRALIKAKEETLPDLFKKVKEKHEAMAAWMKAKLIPMKAEAENLKERTGSIEDRIFTVELYAGLCEELTKIRDGAPAGNDEKIHLLQRRHYMDEECLVDYKAGGMEFKNIEAFDRWLMKKTNRERILPFPKCAVAFRVRREDKEREAVSFGDFIHFAGLREADKRTFLYLRNGNQFYRLDTAIDFGEELFPDLENSHLLGGQAYLKHDFRPELATEAEYRDYQARLEERREEHEQELREWQKKPKKDRGLKPYLYLPSVKFEPLTPETVYYDDGMKKLADQRRDHNRIAVVLQGLLDRSPAFHPHPPWHLWTAEGFASGIELVYDKSRALTVGGAPDFEAYRAKLNASIKKGTNTVGQDDAWAAYEAAKENQRQDRDWRIRHSLHYKRYRPYGNPGPGLVAPIDQLSRDGQMATFRWKRERLRMKRWGRGDPVIATFKCSVSKLLNVDAYVPGDYLQFYADPRTRAQYLKWAPLLLAAEDWHAGKRDCPLPDNEYERD